MAAYYHDSSALIKHYHIGIGTQVVDSILAEPNSILFPDSQEWKCRLLLQRRSERWR